MSIQNNKEEKGWQFLNFGIAGPECMMPFIQEAVQTTFEKELEKADGIFSSKVDTPFEDESLDDLLCVEVYGLHGSFSTFFSELREYKVDEITFGKDLARAIFQMLKGIADFIKTNTNKPQAIKNKIISVLKFTENTPILGLVSQITTLWGLVRMLECCGMDEDSPQYNDFITLHDWIVLEAGKRMYKFAQEPVNIIFNDVDMKRIQPFCDYLYYGTDIGRLANEMALGLIDGDSAVKYDACEEIATDSQTIISNESVAKAGRPKSDDVAFYDLLIGDDSERKRILKILHGIIDGKKGKAVALAIYACYKAGKMSKPTFPQVQKEFGEIGNKQGFNKYFDKTELGEENVKQMMEKFK